MRERRFTLDSRLIALEIDECGPGRCYRQRQLFTSKGGQCRSVKELTQFSPRRFFLCFVFFFFQEGCSLDVDF